MTKEEAKVKAEELLRDSRVDLDVVGRLTQSLRTNSAFSNTLDSQVQVIIERAQATDKRFAELDVIVKEHFLTLDSAPMIGAVEAETLNKRATGTIGPGAVIVDAGKKEEPFDLSKFKDK